jgi:hypothetical protein
MIPVEKNGQVIYIFIIASHAVQFIWCKNFTVWKIFSQGQAGYFGGKKDSGGQGRALHPAILHKQKH